jgi:hypothetical protein
MKLPLLLLLLALAACQSKKATLDQTTIEGTLIKKVWNKSTESYCAGGSDYYVLQDRTGKTQVLQFKEIGKPLRSLLNILEGKRVKATGTFKEKEIAPPAEISQQPVTNDANGVFRCTVFECSNIRE